MAILLRGELHCSAALIGMEYAVTAAHCLVFKNKGYDENDLTIYFGSEEPEKDFEPYRRMRKIKNFFKHPKYNNGKKYPY